MENCVIDRWRGDSGIGINFAPTLGVAKLNVTNCVIKNNGSATAGGGIYILPASGAEADVTIEGSQVEGNRLGILADGAGTTHGVARNSVVSGNTTWGIGAQGSRSTLLIENTTVTGNQAGLVARFTPTCW